MEIAFSVPPVRNEAGTVVPCSELFDSPPGYSIIAVPACNAPCPVSVSVADRTFRNGICHAESAGVFTLILRYFLFFPQACLIFYE